MTISMHVTLGENPFGFFHCEGCGDATAVGPPMTADEIDEAFDNWRKEHAGC